MLTLPLLTRSNEIGFMLKSDNEDIEQYENNENFPNEHF